GPQGAPAGRTRRQVGEGRVLDRDRLVCRPVGGPCPRALDQLDAVLALAPERALPAGEERAEPELLEPRAGDALGIAGQEREPVLGREPLERLGRAVGRAPAGGVCAGKQLEVALLRQPAPL